MTCLDKINSQERASLLGGVMGSSNSGSGLKGLSAHEAGTQLNISNPGASQGPSLKSQGLRGGLHTASCSQQERNAALEDSLEDESREETLATRLLRIPCTSHEKVHESATMLRDSYTAQITSVSGRNECRNDADTFKLIIMQYPSSRD